MQNCPNCGAPVEGRFCQQCGTPMSRPTENSDYHFGGYDQNQNQNYGQGGYQNGGGYNQNGSGNNDGYFGGGQDPYSNPYGGQSPYGGQYQPPGEKVEDKVSIGLCILSFLIPIAGFIIYGMQRKDRPKRAKACLIVGIVSFVLNFSLLMYL